MMGIQLLNSEWRRDSIVITNISTKVPYDESVRKESKHIYEHIPYFFEKKGFFW